MTTRRACLAAAIWLACSGALILAQEAGGKAAVPDAAAQKRARELLHDVYGKEYDGAKTSIEKTELAKKLLDQAANSQGDPPSHFVLLRVTKDVAIQAGDAETALEAVNRIVAAYEVDALEMKLECLEEVAQTAKSSSQHGVIAREGLALIDDAIAQDDFASARQLAKLVSSRAARARDRDLVRQVRDRTKGIEELAKAYEQVKTAMETLEAKPVDPEANLVLGKYFCLVKGDWDKGIPMLALSADPKLKASALKELAGVSSHAAQAELGDGWFDLAASESGTARKQFLARAGHWYRQALPGLAGLARTKVEQRLDGEIFRETTPPQMYLAEMEPFEVTGLHNIDRPLSVGGAKVAHGIWAHPSKRNSSSCFSFHVGKTFREFTGAVGMNDTIPEPRSRSPLTFRILGDGALLWKSAPLRQKGDFLPFQVNISGVEKLQLFVDCPGSHIYAHGVWIDPMVRR